MITVTNWNFKKQFKGPLWAMSIIFWSWSVFAEGVVDPTTPAVIVHLSKNKKGPYAVVNQGSRTGFVIGREVCFYNLEHEKLFCSSIVRTKPRAAAVYLSDEDRPKVDKGFFAWPSGLSEPVFPDKTDGASSSDARALAEEEDDPPEPVLPPLLVPRLQMHIAPSYALPVWMNDIRFNAGARASGTGNIWESGDTIKGSAVGFGARYHRPLAGKGDSAVDLTYHFVPQKPVRDDFDLTDGSIYVESSVLSHHYRLRFLRGATWRHTESSDFLLYTGIGYDYVSTKFLVKKGGSSTDELVSGKLTGHGFEIPVMILWQQFLGSWMLSAGADLAMPLGVYGVKFTGSLSYNEETAGADKSLDTARKAVNMRRGWFSAGLHLGVGRKF